MDSKLIKCSIVTDHNKKEIDMRVLGNRYTSMHEDITLSVEFEENLMRPTISNESNDEIVVERIEFQLLELSFREYNTYIRNPENPKEQITLTTIENQRGEQVQNSFLFTVLINKEYPANIVFGFLGGHSSRNLIEFSLEGSRVKVFAVYDFVKQRLQPGEKITLDPLYTKFAVNYFELINQYVKAMKVTYPLQEEVFEPLKDTFFHVEGSSLLFTKKPTPGVTLKKGNKYCKIKGEKEDLFYPIDLASEEGINTIQKNIEELKRENVLVLHIKNVGSYVQEAITAKVFNPYYELTKLLGRIKKELKEVCFYFEDCPQGISIGNTVMIQQEFNFVHTKKFLETFLSKPSTSNTQINFMIKILLQQAVLGHSTKFVMEECKAKEVLEAVTRSKDKGRFHRRELQQIREDLEHNYTITPYMDKEEIFALVVTGATALYIAVFNFSKKPAKFYCDLMKSNPSLLLDGTATEVFSKEKYLISEGKVYLKRVLPMECCVIQKSFKKYDIIGGQK